MTTWLTYGIELSLQSRAHFVDLIFQKWSDVLSCFCGFYVKSSSCYSLVLILSTSSSPPSQQLLPLVLLRCLTFPLPPSSLSPIFCGHLASISTCLFPPFLSTSSCRHLVSISKFPPPCAFQQLPAFIWSQTFPLRLTTLFAYTFSSFNV